MTTTGLPITNTKQCNTHWQTQNVRQKNNLLPLITRQLNKRHQPH